MVERGEAVRIPKHRAKTVEDMFYLTRHGAEKARRRGEVLDPEDFPPEAA